MTEQEKVEALEKRLQFITTTLINAQTELAKVKTELEVLRKNRAGQVVAETKVETKTPPAVQVQEQKTEAPKTLPPKPVIVTPPAAKKNMEEFIGGNVINKIGIVILVLGFGILLKYAIDNDLINPLTRVVIGLASGATVLVLAFRMKEKYNAFSAVLLSGGIAILYFSVFAAYDFYGLIPQTLAFVLMVLLTAFTVFAATIYDRQIIGIYGLVGAYAVPFLLSEGEGKVVILLSYVTIINIGILFLAFRRNWVWLNYLAFTFTWLIFNAWFLDRYKPDEHLTIAVSFSLAFFIMFYLMTVAYKFIKKEVFGIKDVVILSLNSFVYYGVGYTIFEKIDNGLYLGIFTVANAVLHFPFTVYSYKANLTDRRFFYLQIGLVLSFISIAIPVQLNGNWVTLIWGIEAFLLFWIGRTQKVIFYERLAYGVVILSFISLMQDWETAYNFYNVEDSANWRFMLNINFLTSMVIVLSYIGIVKYSFDLKYRYAEIDKSLITTIGNYMVSILTVFVAYFTMLNEIGAYWDHLYYASQLIIDGTIYNYDLHEFRDIWLVNYTLVFLSVLTLLVSKRWPSRGLVWSVLGLNMLSLVVAMFVILEALIELRTSYIGINDFTRYFPPGSMHIGIRYLCYFFAAELMYLTMQMLNRHWAEYARYFPIFVNLLVIAVLSNELTTWLVLVNPENHYEMEELSYQIGYSILWGVYSLATIGYGIWKRRKVLRIFAIVLFAITLIKLYLIDLGDISTGYKIILFIALGILLLTVSFLYQKFKHIIFAEDENK